MKLTNEAKKDILDLVLSLIAVIADIEYQTRVWIRGEGPEVDDFDETACHFLHEGTGVLEKYKDFGMTESQYQRLKKLRDEFKAFSDENDFPEEFIDSPEWARIMDLAKEVLKAFNYKKVRN
jgi:hypothetical protein